MSKSTAKRQNTNAASERTRSQIILAAERLFAEHGIDAVSLRQVNVAAEQKNSSATHYHFGSKEALVRSIYDFRMAPVNTRRQEMIDDLPKEPTVRQLVETIVLPIVEEIDNSEGGSHYIRFLSQIAGHPSVDLGEIWESEHGTAMNDVARSLATALPYLPPAIFGHRFGLALSQIIHALSDREKLTRTRYEKAGSNTRSEALYVNNLVDSVAGGLAAPVSETTRKELDHG